MPRILGLNNKKAGLKAPAGYSLQRNFKKILYFFFRNANLFCRKIALKPLKNRRLRRKSEAA